MKAPAASPGRGPAHVLMTTDAVGGVWTYALDLSRGLAAAGTRVTLAVLGPSADADQAAQAAASPGVELADTGLPLDWLASGPAEVRRAARGVAALARSCGADLVHLNSPALAGLAAFPAPVVGVAHSCVGSWWAAVKAEPLPASYRWSADLLVAGYGACGLVLAPSAAFADQTERAHGLRPRVVWNGRAAPPERRTGPRRRLVVTSGRLWDQGKDARTLDAAAALIDAPLVGYGARQGPNGERVELAHMQAPGLVGSARLAAALAQARVFASAALYEPFGLAVLEAAQAGCALVLTDTPTFRELWEGAAVFAPTRDAPAFAAALQGLLDDEVRARRLAAAARRRARRYGLEPFVRAMQAAYASVLGAGREEAAA